MIDKTKLKDVMGRPLTQGLFLEFNYDTTFAMFTFKDDDYEHNGKLYISLKKLYLEMADPTEYTFAKKYLLGWQHWRRLNENKVLAKEFDEWREELEVALKSEALLAITDMTDNFQAQKFLADRGWEKNGVGRPKKVDPMRDEKMQDKIAEELKDTLTRMDKYKVA